MADEDTGGGFQRQMYQGNWTCSGCGNAITELPFEPDPSRADSLLCRECHQQKRDSRGGGGGGGGFGRKMFQGNWKCSGCGGDITELPFEPDPSRLENLKCRDCFKKEKGY
ncbi:hypothetical protein CL629_03905 [bacterium]|nr:hypothetical protein [bacterium]